MTSEQLHAAALQWLVDPTRGFDMLEEIGQLELLRVASGREGDLDPEDFGDVCEEVAAGRAQPLHIALLEMMDDTTHAKMNKLLQEPIKWD